MNEQHKNGTVTYSDVCIILDDTLQELKEIPYEDKTDTIRCAEWLLQLTKVLLPGHHEYGPGYVEAWFERNALATSNSDLRSELLAAQQTIKELQSRKGSK